MICNKCNHKLPSDSEFCQYCGCKIEELVGDETKETPVESEISLPKSSVYVLKSNIKRDTAPNNKLVLFTNISAIVLTIVSMISIIFAMNIQDYRRNEYESWNTTTVYFVLLFILGAVLCVAINSLIKKQFLVLPFLSYVPIVASIITVAEGSIMSHHSGILVYNDYFVVDTLNAIWIICVILVLFFAYFPVVNVAIKRMKNKWYDSISYREKCYRRIEKIHNYLEKGIITQEEFEKAKIDILKHIQ